MMRRGPLADNPIEELLADAARERTNGVLELHCNVNGLVYLVDGEIYLAELEGQPPLDERLVAAGLLSEAQVREHGVPGESGVYLARALDTDATIDEDAIDAYLLDATAATLARFIGVSDGEYELDPYGAHAAGVLSSWTLDTVLVRVEELREEAARLEAERAEAERVAAEEAAKARAEAERLEAERLAEVRREAERVEAERAEAERVAAEEAAEARAEAERLEAERLAEVRREAERVEAEGKAQGATESEGSDEAGPSASPEAAGTTEPSGASGTQTAAVDGGGAADVDIANLPAPPETESDDSPPLEAPRSRPSADALIANSVPLDEREPGGLGEIGAGVLLVVPDESPEGLASIELSPIEWKVVVLAAQGDSLGGIAARLDLDLDATREVVDRLWCRGLVATIGPGGPV
jgi:hypothetical protein